MKQKMIEIVKCYNASTKDMNIIMQKKKLKLTCKKLTNY